MCLTLHLDNKRFLCLFVKFVLYRGPVLCEKHRISFFISTMFPVRVKTFSTHVAFILVHVVRKSGLSTHAGNELPCCFLHLPNFHMKDKPGGGGDAGGMDARVLVNGCQATA